MINDFDSMLLANNIQLNTDSLSPLLQHSGVFLTHLSCDLLAASMNLG